MDAYFGSQLDQRFNENCSLHGHVQATRNTGALHRFLRPADRPQRH